MDEATTISVPLVSRDTASNIVIQAKQTTPACCHQTNLQLNPNLSTPVVAYQRIQNPITAAAVTPTDICKSQLNPTTTITTATAVTAATAATTATTNVQHYQLPLQQANYLGNNLKNPPLNNR